MSRTKQGSDERNQGGSVGEARSEKGLYAVIALLAFVVLVGGSRLLGQRPEPGPVTRAQPTAEITPQETDLASTGNPQLSTKPTPAPMVAVPTAEAAEPTAASVAAAPTADLPVAPVEGSRAPDFELTDLNGEEWTLSALRGKVILLNFWTAW